MFPSAFIDTYPVHHHLLLHLDAVTLRLMMTTGHLVRPILSQVFATQSRSSQSCFYHLRPLAQHFQARNSGSRA